MSAKSGLRNVLGTECLGMRRSGPMCIWERYEIGPKRPNPFEYSEEVEGIWNLHNAFQRKDEKREKNTTK